MAGKIRNPLAIRDTLVYGSSLVPSYDRKLKGIKVGLRKAKNKLELMAVKIEDDPESFEYPDKTFIIKKTIKPHILTNKKKEKSTKVIIHKPDVISGLCSCIIDSPVDTSIC